MSDKNTADRRDFLKQSTAAAVGATVLGTLGDAGGRVCSGRRDGQGGI